MQRGTASSGLALSGPSSPIFGAGCGDVRYQPRMELPSSTETRRARLFPLIAATACEYQIPVGLFDALIWQESRYQINARSPKGAIGLVQLMPGTAEYLGVSNPWDVVENLRGGARYLRIQIDEFGRYDLALAAYNAGPGRVRPNRRIPRIRETLDYVRKITAFWLAAERQSVARISPPLPSTARIGFRGAVFADYMSASSANPR
ncbi:MAG: lytic transglycosylase domain-containing protein [Porphyrobacter sp. IPPAS B-1204]|nr:MAG: lytic transglycosylase domain-containing protein [Porphyrobacter sp. IPPAS B-1204]